MKTKSILILLCFAFIISIFTACSSEAPSEEIETTTEQKSISSIPKDDSSFKLCYTQSDSLNPYECETQNNQTISQLVFESLFNMDEHFKASCNIAEKYEYPDSKTLRVTIKDGFVFSDGTSLTADDITYSFRKAVKSSYWGSSLSGISSCNAVSSTVVDFNLEYPNSYAHNLLIFPIMSQSSEISDFPIGSGRYYFAKEEDITVRIFTMMLPFLLMTFLFSGAMGICSDSIAGEKERGTIATLLVTPTKRSWIAIGKVSALGITALTSALVSFLGLIASLPKLVGTNLSLAAYNVQTIFMLLIVIVLTVLLFTVVLTMVSTFAKSVKEASSLSIPVMILVMLMGATSFMGTTAQTNPAFYLIPVYGAIQSLTGILSMTISPLCFTMFILSSVVYISLGVFGLTKMFNSEKIMFNI
ncbi:MAG: ABC transporter permease subunit [Anaeroplasmataceae bacterium]|nr:ABC transporter permease subunit [Anaeroplasmataceae bacterium]